MKVSERNGEISVRSGRGGVDSPPLPWLLGQVRQENFERLGIGEDGDEGI
jgi:hypothetical protein